MSFERSSITRKESVSVRMPLPDVGGRLSVGDDHTSAPTTGYHPFPGLLADFLAP